MYKMNVQVPHVTSKTLLDILVVAPQLNLLVDIPLVDTPERATEHAISKGKKSLRNSLSDYVVRGENATLSEDGTFWNVELEVLDD